MDKLKYLEDHSPLGDKGEKAKHRLHLEKIEKDKIWADLVAFKREITGYIDAFTPVLEHYEDVKFEKGEMVSEFQQLISVGLGGTEAQQRGNQYLIDQYIREIQENKDLVIKELLKLTDKLKKIKSTRTKAKSEKRLYVSQAIQGLNTVRKVILEEDKTECHECDNIECCTNKTNITNCKWMPKDFPKGSYGDPRGHYTKAECIKRKYSRAHKHEKKDSRIPPELIIDPRNKELMKAKKDKEDRETTREERYRIEELKELLYGLSTKDLHSKVLLGEVSQQRKVNREEKESRSALIDFINRMDPWELDPSSIDEALLSHADVIAEQNERGDLRAPLGDDLMARIERLERDDPWRFARAREQRGELQAARVEALKKRQLRRPPLAAHMKHKRKKHKRQTKKHKIQTKKHKIQTKKHKKPNNLTKKKHMKSKKTKKSKKT